MFPLGPLLNHNVAAMGAPTGAWTPTSLGSGLAAWYDADQQTEADGTTVATLVDRSGNAMDFLDATSGIAKPVIRYSSINGKKTLEFNGSSNWMTCSSGLLNGATAGCWLAVIKISADPPTLEGPVVDGFGAGDNHHPFSDGIIYDGFCTSARKTCGNPTPSLASPAWIGSISASGDYRFLVNNATLFSTGTNTVSVGTGTRQLGKSTSGSFIAGQIAELIVLNYVPSSTDLSNWNSYVNTKFGTAF